MAVTQEKLKNNKKELFDEAQKRLFNGRVRFVFILIFLFILYLLYKIAFLQIINVDTLLEKANNRILKTTEIPFTRGRILDRNGRILSISTIMHSIEISPKDYFDDLLMKDLERWRKLELELDISRNEMQKSAKKFIENKWTGEGKKYDARAIFDIKKDAYWELLSRVSGVDYHLLSKVRQNPDSEFLKLEYEAIRYEIEKFQLMTSQVGLKYNDFMESLYQNSHRRYMSIARHQSEETENYIKSLKITGISSKEERRSFYPVGEATAQLVGYTNKDGYGRDPNGGNNHGYGLEYSLDEYLTGTPGKRVYQKDSRGNIINILNQQAKYDPQDVVLSIDENIQSFAYETLSEAVKKHKAKSGTVVLIDINTGEVLTMLSAPSFNPNDKLRKGFASEFARNRAVTDLYEPGSTVKPFVVVTGLQHRTIQLDSVINTRPFVANNSTINDPSPREQSTLTEILQKSSNVGVARIARELPSINLLIDTYSKIGFGQPVKLGLASERAGTNGQRDRWSDIEQASIAYGYGLQVSPLQLARAYATLGSYGIYRPLSITRVDPPILGPRVLSEKFSRDVIKMLESVAMNGGTAPKAAIDGYRVAVKTGTARKLEVDEEQSQKQKKTIMRYSTTKHIALIAGVAPASDPRFALVVLVDEPSTGPSGGGEVSGPLFSKIMERTLKSYNIKPDAL